MPPKTEDRFTLGVWLDRLLIACITVVFIYFGTQLRDLTVKVGSLAETMSSIATKIEFTNEKADKLDERTSKLSDKLDRHLESERIAKK